MVTWPKKEEVAEMMRKGCHLYVQDRGNYGTFYFLSPPDESKFIYVHKATFKALKRAKLIEYCPDTDRLWRKKFILREII